MRTSQGWASCAQLLRASIGRSRTGWLRGVGLVVAVVGAASLMMASVSPVSAAPADPILGWGDDSTGQLGDGTLTTTSTPVPTKLPPGTTVTKVVGGFGHTLGLTSDGKVLAWGANNFGQLGNGTNNNSKTPVPVTLGTTTVTDIAAAEGFSLALTSGKKVLAWGFGRDGEMGNGANNNSNTPVSVTLGTTNVTKIAAGGGTALALTDTGKVKAWGFGLDGNLGNGANNNSNTPVDVTLGTQTVTDIAAGEDHALAVKTDGTALAWGFNFFGQLGNGTNTPSNTPVPVTLGTQTVTTVSAKGNFSLALKPDGTLLAWGFGEDGELGNGANNSSNTPVPVTLGGQTVTAIATGFFHSLALKPDGTVLAWGDNTFGQLDNGNTNPSNTPVPVTLGTAATAIGAGDEFSLAIVKELPPPTTTTTPTITTTTKTVTKTTTETVCCHDENNNNNNNNDENHENNNEDHEHEDYNNNNPWRLPMAR